VFGGHFIERSCTGREAQLHLMRLFATSFRPPDAARRPHQAPGDVGQAVVDMLKKKQAGIPAPRERPAARPQNVVNLIDALRRSVAQEKRAPASSKKGRKRVAGQTEMLLPIAGKKKGKKAAVKPVAKPTARQRKAG
jgi:DNA end-binding protein Ku